MTARLRLAPVTLATLLVSLLTTFYPRRVAAREVVQRPFEAPLFDTTPVVPPLPAEYLQHDQKGIRFAYHPSARERVRSLIGESDEARSELSMLLGAAVLSSIDIRIAVGSGDFDRVVPVGTPRGAGPVAISQARLMVMALRAGPTAASEVRAAFRRGLAYLALDEVAGFDHLPRWVRVGFALHFAGTGTLPRSRALWWASMERRLLPLADLDHHLVDRSDHESVAAAEAADFVGFLLEPEREAGWSSLVHASRDHAFSDAVLEAYQEHPERLEARWREDVAKHKAFVPILAGGTGLWVLLAAGVHLRRRLRAREERGTEPRPRRDKPEPEPTVVRVDKAKRRRASITAIPEPDVPKVAHNGRWHTLH